MNEWKNDFSVIFCACGNRRERKKEIKNEGWRMRERDISLPIEFIRRECFALIIALCVRGPSSLQNRRLCAHSQKHLLDELKAHSREA